MLQDHLWSVKLQPLVCLLMYLNQLVHVQRGELLLLDDPPGGHGSFIAADLPAFFRAVRSRKEHASLPCFLSSGSHGWWRRH